MRTLLPRNCPACEQPFQPRRKNQLYCSADCRTDANNASAKTRHDSLKEAAPQIDAFRERIRVLEQALASLTIVIEGVEEVDPDTIRYQGETYIRGRKQGKMALRLSLQAGGALKVGLDKILYLRERGERDVYTYALARKPSTAP